RIITIGRNDGPSISVDTLRIVAGLHGTNTPADLLPKHDDPAIRGTQVLQTMDGDRPLPNLRLVISRATLTGLIGARFWELAGEHDVTVGPPGWRHSWRLADVAEFNEHRVGVVLRHNPTAHHGTAKGMLLMAIFPHRRHLLQVGQHRFDHPGPDVLAHAPGCNIDHTGRGLEEIQFWHLTKLVSKLRARDDGMEKRRVHVVHGIFQHLHPV